MADAPGSRRMRAESARGGCRPEIRPEYSSCRPRVPFVEDVVVRSALASHGELSAKALPETVHLQEFGEIVDLAAARVRLEVGCFDFDVGKRGEDRGGSAQLGQERLHAIVRLRALHGRQNPLRNPGTERIHRRIIDSDHADAIVDRESHHFIHVLIIHLPNPDIPTPPKGKLQR